MALSDWLKLFATCQGTYSAVMAAAVFFYSLFFWRKNRKHQAILVALTLAHILMIVATSITLYKEVYAWGDIWYWIVASGYFLSDVFLTWLWIKVIKNNVA